MTESELRRLHGYSTLNRHSIEASRRAYCFQCLKSWDPKVDKVQEWVDNSPFSSRTPHAGKNGNATALCPFCGIDSVLGELSVGELTEETLRELHEYWFGPS